MIPATVLDQHLASIGELPGCPFLRLLEDATQDVGSSSSKPS